MSTKNEFRIDGKVAMITGGARGIGAECARVLAAAGASVMVTDILGAAGRATVGEIQAEGGKAAYLDLDITREDEWIAVIDATIATFGGFDVLVNNPGIVVWDGIDEVTDSYEEYRHVMTANLDGVFLGCKHALIAMRPGGKAGCGGSIINMSAAAGQKGLPWSFAYGASKGAVGSMTKEVMRECCRLGYRIRCNAIHPDYAATNVEDLRGRKSTALASGKTSSDVIEVADNSVQSIGLAMARDIANAVRFLASDAASWITGLELPANSA